MHSKLCIALLPSLPPQYLCFNGCFSGQVNLGCPVHPKLFTLIFLSLLVVEESIWEFKWQIFYGQNDVNAIKET